MKKIILTFALFIGVTVAANAQSNAAGTVTEQKPKTAVSAATTTATADTASTAVAKKKPARKSCCKKSGEGTPCNNSTSTAKPKSSATKQD